MTQFGEPKKKSEKTKEPVSYNEFLKKYNHYSEAAKQIIKKNNIPVSHHRVHAFVDLYGVYDALTNYLKQNDFPLLNGMVISRVFIHSLNSLFSSIRTKELRKIGRETVDLESFVNMVSKQKHDEISKVKSVIDFTNSFEFFYATVPLPEIIGHMERRARSGFGRIQSQLKDAKLGVLHVHNKQRDYSAYEDFARCLKLDKRVTGTSKGFYNFYVNDEGLKHIDEKQVDTLLTMRATDACYENSAESMCIVSSDQDFIPVIERWKQAGISPYQADIAKGISGGNIGNRLKSLGDSFIETKLNMDWPLSVILDAGDFCGFPLEVGEAEALCAIYNNVHDVKIRFVQTSDGPFGLELFRPL